MQNKYIYKKNNKQTTTTKRKKKRRTNRALQDSSTITPWATIQPTQKKAKNGSQKKGGENPETTNRTNKTQTYY